MSFVDGYGRPSLRAGDAPAPQSNLFSPQFLTQLLQHIFKNGLPPGIGGMMPANAVQTPAPPPNPVQVTPAPATPPAAPPAGPAPTTGWQNKMAAYPTSTWQPGQGAPPWGQGSTQRAEPPKAPITGSAITGSGAGGSMGGGMSSGGMGMGANPDAGNSGGFKSLMPFKPF